MKNERPFCVVTIMKCIHMCMLLKAVAYLAKGL